MSDDTIKWVDVLKRMVEDDLGIQLATSENLLQLSASKKGTKVTFGVPGNQVSGFYSGRIGAFLVIYERAEWRQTLEKMEQEQGK